MVSMIEKLIKIVTDVGEKILEIYNGVDFDVGIKGDNSPLTKADTVANETIINRLMSMSDYPIVTEETYVEYEKRKNWNRFWLIDPLDGTKDFIARNNEFTINIALIADTKPILGLVYAPALNLMYWAQCEKGAFKNGKKICNDTKRTELIGGDSRFHSTKETSQFFANHNIKTIIRYGSAIKLCKLAEGEIDVYPRFNGTNEWDTAAAHIIANEANCKVVDVVMKTELTYNKESMKNNHFVASRNNLNFL